MMLGLKSISKGKEMIFIQCNKCFEFKSVDEFHKNKRNSRGYLAMCKDCNKKRRGK